MPGFDESVEMGAAADDAGLQGEREACLGLILQLRSHGIRNARVLSAIERVPRRLFLTARQHILAYVDTQLPIECGQSSHSPSTVALLLQHLDVRESDTVLEVGTGSGYQTALLSQLAATVVSLERYRTLLNLARQRLATLKAGNALVHLADGLEGWEEEAPFDRIVLSGSVAEIPAALKQQLAEDGILVAAVGAPGQPQALMRVERRDGGFSEKEVARVRFVPLSAGIANRL